MRAFASALSVMNDVLQDVFGDTVQITLADNTALMVSGVFSRQREDVEKNLAPSYRYTVEVKTADVQAFGVAKRDTVKVEDVDYTIIDIVPGDGGMTTYVLKRYG
jgi:hypothetical protein